MRADTSERFQMFRVSANWRRALAGLGWGRRLLLPALSRFNPGDITVRHALTEDPVRLHSYRHRGFWFYGAARESYTTDLWRRWIKPGDTVLDVGAHIGYLTVLLSRLAGPAGGVFAFEPGANNLPYLERNVEHLRNVRIEPVALGNQDGQVPFFLEALTGQNNSLSADYDLFAANRASAHSSESYQSTKVSITTLDLFCTERNLEPNWIKIDVEGHEIDVLRGGTLTISSILPALTLEVTRNNAEVALFLKELDYVLINACTLKPVENSPSSGDFFALHPSKHEPFLTEIGISR